MLDRVSDAALGALAGFLADEHAQAVKAATSPDEYSRALVLWMLDACSDEQARRRGGERRPLYMPNLPAEELARAARYAGAEAITFGNFGAFIDAVAPDTDPATRKRCEAHAAELEPVFVALAGALTFLLAATSPNVTVH